MKLSISLIFLLVVLGPVLVPSATFAKDVALCPRFVLRDEDKLELTDVERRLICGDPKNEAWDNIPDNQAIFHLKTFFQERAYYNPGFESREGKIFIDAGPRTRVAIFKTPGISDEIRKELDIDRMRRIEGEPLTPKLLDTVSTRLRGKLMANGFACPEIEMAANPKTGELTATVKPGPRQNLVRVSEEPIDGLDERVMRRYHAFELGKPYNEELLGITSRRILDDAVVQSTHFTHKCEAEGVVAEQKFVAGPPRLITLGFGVDTERWLLLRAAWKNSRMGREGSVIDLVANASFRDQELRGTASWFLFSRPWRFYLRPGLSLRHDTIPIEQYKAKLQIAPATTWDNQDFGIRASVGPAANFVETVRGNGPRNTPFASITSELRLMSHGFEANRTSPRTGWLVQLETDHAHRNILAPFTGHKVRITYEKLWNLFSFDPPLLVFGIRGLLATTFTDESLQASALSADFRHFLGGSQDLRGFPQRKVPSDEGALTAVSTSAEVRLADYLPFNLQPFIFTDIGMTGDRSAKLQDPIFLSPGLGLRWQSPIGTIRGSLAHGFLLRDSANFARRPNLQLFLSFGEEF